MRSIRSIFRPLWWSLGPDARQGVRAVQVFVAFRTIVQGDLEIPEVLTESTSFDGVLPHGRRTSLASRRDGPRSLSNMRMDAPVCSLARARNQWNGRSVQFTIPG